VTCYDWYYAKKIKSKNSNSLIDSVSSTRCTTNDEGLWLNNLNKRSEMTIIRCHIVLTRKIRCKTYSKIDFSFFISNKKKRNQIMCIKFPWCSIIAFEIWIVPKYPMLNSAAVALVVFNKSEQTPGLICNSCVIIIRDNLLNWWHYATIIPISS